MDEYQSIVRNLLVAQIKSETRMSERQIALMRWVDIGDHTITTHLGRVAKISDATYRALLAIPVKGGYVFSTSRFIPIGAPEPSKREKRAEAHARRRANRKHIRLSIKFE